MPTLKIVVSNTFLVRLLISSIVDISIYVRTHAFLDFFSLSFWEITMNLIFPYALIFYISSDTLFFIWYNMLFYEFASFMLDHIIGRLGILLLFYVMDGMDSFISIVYIKNGNIERGSIFFFSPNYFLVKFS